MVMLMRLVLMEDGIGRGSKRRSLANRHFDLTSTFVPTPE